MKERGLVFATENVPKVLDGSKFVTRRLGGLKDINENPDRWTSKYDAPLKHGAWVFQDSECPGIAGIKCPQGVAGDTFYMKETWGLLYPGTHKPYDLGADAYKAWRERNEAEEQAGIVIPIGPLHPVYKIDCPEDLFTRPRWRSGRFMPKWAARRKRWELVSVRPERVQDMDDADTKAELGLELCNVWDFINLWNRINEKRGYPWHDNPWVWRVEWNPEPVVKG